MTTPNDIIRRSLRLLGIYGTGDAVGADEADDALSAFNAMLSDVRPPLPEVRAKEAYEAESDVRVLVDTTGGALSLTLPDEPRDGMRVSVVDVGGALATNNLTVKRNGSCLEGAAADIALNTNGLSRTWEYQSETGDWVRLAEPYALADTLPFPDRLTDAFARALALRLCDEFGRALTPTMAALCSAGDRKIRARYAIPSRPVAVDYF